MKDIANNISPMLQWTSDVPSNYQDRKVPCLDLKISKHPENINNKIQFEFYKKSVSRNTLVTSNSALPTSTKFSVLVAEGTRRLKNTMPCLVESNMPAIMQDFNFWMKESGHNSDFRYRITKRVLTLYQSWVSKDKLEGIPLHRSKDEIIKRLECKE